MDIKKLNKYKKEYINKNYEPKIKNKVLKIQHSRLNTMYISTFGMSFVSKDNIQVSAFTSCRDYLHDQIRTHLNKGKRLRVDTHEYYPKNGDPPLYMDKLKLLVQFEENKISNFLNSVKVLNNIESFANIVKTKIYNVEYTKPITKHSCIFMIEANGLYMKNPHLLSLLTIILRFFTLNDIKPFEKKYITEKDLIKQYGIAVDIKRDSHIMEPCYKYLHLILKMNKELFKDKTLPELFPVIDTSLFHSAGGILNLCTFRTLNKDVNERIKLIIHRK